MRLGHRRPSRQGAAFGDFGQEALTLFFTAEMEIAAGSCRWNCWPARIERCRFGNACATSSLTMQSGGEVAAGAAIGSPAPTCCRRPMSPKIGTSSLGKAVGVVDLRGNRRHLASRPSCCTAVDAARPVPRSSYMERFSYPSFLSKPGAPNLSLCSTPVPNRQAGATSAEFISGIGVAGDQAACRPQTRSKPVLLLRTCFQWSHPHGATGRACASIRGLEIEQAERASAPATGRRPAGRARCARSPPSRWPGPLRRNRRALGRTALRSWRCHQDVETLRQRAERG